MWRVLLVLWGGSLLGAPSPQWRSVCSNVQIAAKSGISFSSEERFLICGDTKIAAWSKVSPPEQRYYLGTTLEGKGYANPRFESRGGTLYVDPGVRYTLNSIEVSEGGETKPVPVPSELYHQTLTPKLLDSVAEWVATRKRDAGYPCPRVKLEVTPKIGKILARVEPGKKQTIRSIDVSGNVLNSVVARNMAIETGERYNLTDVRLSEARLLASENVRSGFLRHRCSDSGVELYGEAVASPGKLIRIGAGLNSETWFKVRALWKNNRVGKLGSVLAGQVQASRQVQAIEGTLQWYPWSQTPRHHLHFEARTEHHWEKFSRWVKLSLTPSVRLGFETPWGRSIVAAGPEFSLVRSLEGPGITNSSGIQFSVRASLTSPEFELYRVDPRGGGYLTSSLTFSPVALGSPVDFFRYQLKGSHYWNLFDTGSPLFLFQLRGALTGTSLLSGNSSSLPADAFYFLGGAETVRGFPRNSLPGSQGALTRFNLTAEWIFRGAIGEGFDPFFFVDFAKAGDSLANWKPGTFWSPGMGLRWRSPIAPVALSVGRGLTNGVNADPSWNVYLSLGEEF